MRRVIGIALTAAALALVLRGVQASSANADAAELLRCNVVFKGTATTTDGRRFPLEYVPTEAEPDRIRVIGRVRPGVRAAS